MSVQPVCLYVCHICIWCPQGSEGIRYPGTVLIDDYETPCGCWNSNLGPLQEQSPCNNTKQSLQSPRLLPNCFSQSFLCLYPLFIPHLLSISGAYMCVKLQRSKYYLLSSKTKFPTQRGCSIYSTYLMVSKYRGCKRW